MAKPPDPLNEIVRANLRKFREAASLSQADAADLSGVTLDNLRRYENGVTDSVPGTALSQLAKAYGHSTDDFFEADPPPAKLAEIPTFFYRKRPGADVDPKIEAKLQEAVDEANREQRGKRARKG